MDGMTVPDLRHHHFEDVAWVERKETAEGQKCRPDRGHTGGINVLFKSLCVPSVLIYHA